MTSLSNLHQCESSRFYVVLFLASCFVLLSILQNFLIMHLSMGISGLVSYPLIAGIGERYMTIWGQLSEGFDPSLLPWNNHFSKAKTNSFFIFLSRISIRKIMELKTYTRQTSFRQIKLIPFGLIDVLRNLS